MKRTIPATLAALATAGLLAQAAEAATLFTLDMDAAQAGTASPGSATATATLTQDGSNHLSFEILFDGTYDFTGQGGGGAGGSETVTGLHFHSGARGVNGGVVFGMIAPNHDLDSDLSISPSGGGTLVTGEWDSGEGSTNLDSFVAALLAANPGEDVSLYVNLHTSSFGGGAIRGQVVAVPEPATVALLAGALALLGLRRRPH